MLLFEEQRRLVKVEQQGRRSYAFIYPPCRWTIIDSLLPRGRNVISGSGTGATPERRN